MVAWLPAPGERWGRSQRGEAGQARAGAETQCLFWESAEVGVEGQDLRSRSPHGHG